MADLNALRELLRRAGHGEVGPDEVTGSLLDYWRDHGPLVLRAASSAGELLRRQALSELYRWRDQLSAQLQARDTALSRSTRSPAAPGTHDQSDSDHGSD